MVLMFGRMMYQNCCHLFAPSKLAASKSCIAFSASQQEERSP